MKPMQYRIFEENFKLFPFQKLYFSRYNYGHLVPVFPEEAESIPSLDTLVPGTPLLVITGVANPKPFSRFLRRRKAKVKLKRFADHHNFTASDMAEIEREFNALPGNDKFIATTEKDAVRLFNNPYFPTRSRAAYSMYPSRSTSLTVRATYPLSSVSRKPYATHVCLNLNCLNNAVLGLKTSVNTYYI